MSIELLKLILMEISYEELSVTMKNFSGADVTPIRKNMYVEARTRNYSPEDALK